MSFIRIAGEERPYRALDMAAQIILGAVAFALPLFILPFTRDRYDFPKMLLLAAGALLALFLFLLKATLTRAIEIRRTIIDIPIAVFLIALLFSSAMSVSQSVSWLGRLSGFTLSFFAFVFFAICAWLMAQYVRSARSWRVHASLFLLSGAAACAMYLFRDLPVLAKAVALTGWNTVSPVNSAFGMFAALVAVVSLGFILDRERRFAQAIIPALSAVMAIAALSRLGFRISWILFAIGTGLLIVLGSMRLRSCRLPVLLVCFFLFLASIGFIFTDTPSFLKEPLPVEIALGNRASWTMSTAALLHSAKSFFVGFGPGTFMQVYARFRTPELNAVDIAWSSRFPLPFSSAYALLAETGMAGFLPFFFALLIAVGALLAAMLRFEREEEAPDRADIAVLTDADENSVRQAEIFAVGAAWLSATFGLGLSFYGATMWFSWWWLLTLLIIGLSAFSRQIVRALRVSLDVSAPYALVLSFSTVLLFTVILFVGVFLGKVYAAEIYFTRAFRARAVEEQESALQKALQLRPRMSEYELALAGAYFGAARAASERGASVDETATRLAQAVNTARAAADHDPNNVETWESLSVAYTNARAFAPEATGWAKDALEHAIALEPSNPVFYLQLGLLLEPIVPEQAEKAYRQAIVAKRDYLPAYNRLAEMYERKNRLKEAINLYQPVLGVVERDPDALFSLGRLLYNRGAAGDADLAERSWLLATQLSPQHSNALYSLGLFYEKRGERSKALDYFKRVRDLNPDNTDVRKKTRELGGR